MSASVAVCDALACCLAALAWCALMAVGLPGLMPHDRACYVIALLGGLSGAAAALLIEEET